MAVLSCLQAPDLEEQTRSLQTLMTQRYQEVIACLPDLSAVGITAYPFNSGCFALLKLPKQFDPHTLRRRLIEDHSVGLIALPSHQSLRLAYCSTSSSQIEPALKLLAQAVGS